MNGMRLSEHLCEAISEISRAQREQHEAVGSATGRRRAGQRAESRPGLLSRKEKTVANKALEKAGFGGRVKFKSVGEALNVIAGVLEKHGIEWDQVNSADLFRDDSGHRSIRLASKNIADSFSPTSISNSSLAFQWTKLDSGRYEVISYLG